MFAGKPAPMVRVIPESILQSCIKVANEAPTDAKANMRMAYANFSDATWSEAMAGDSKKLADCKNCLFTLCVFHTLLLGRKKFGQQGWSRGYSFNTGDLTISSNVLVSYIQNNRETPYADLRYIFGEIMYGGHITDPWDRRTDNTYLEVLLHAGTQKGFEPMPGFKLPDSSEMDYAGYCAYIEDKMPDEDPTMYGLHTNAGISNQIDMCNLMFDTIQTLQGSGGSGDDDGSGTNLATMVDEYLQRLPDNFNMFEIRTRAVDKTPYVMIVLQETERMNTLLSEIRRSLIELTMGLQGALNMSEQMEALAAALQVGRVPSGWAKYAYASKKSLIAWFSDLLERVGQLRDWADTLKVPRSVWISGLFNGQAFLTAIKQTTARREELPLDTMDLLTDVTKMNNPALIENEVTDGCLVHGFFLEGARWDSGDVGDANAGNLADSFLKELHPPLPVVHVYSKAQPAYAERLKVGYYECPVFVTSARGGTFVFSATLKMGEDLKDTQAKWVLAGVALLMSEE